MDKSEEHEVTCFYEQDKLTESVMNGTNRMKRVKQQKIKIKKVAVRR